MNGVNTNTSGDNQAAFRLKPAAVGDRIPDWLGQELTRRGFVVVEVTVESNIIISPEAPEDKTKVWFKADVSGIPQGSAQIYNSETGKWEGITQPVVTLPKRRYGVRTVPAGASQANLDWETMGTVNLHLNVTPTCQNGNGTTFNSPPASIPTNYGWVVSNLTETGATVNFYGMPTGGLNFFWEVVERE